MPAIKDENGKKWIARFRYKDWQGNTKEVYKRGFETRRDALEYEDSIKSRMSGNIDMMFPDFVEIYKEDISPRIKQSTAARKESMINKHLLPYFKNKKLSEIKPSDVLKWQNALLMSINPKTGKKYSDTFLKTLHEGLSAILNHAVKYYGLTKNAASLAGSIGSSKTENINFWTTDDYTKFREVIKKDNPFMYCCFEVLYWTGIREGELLALTPADINLEKNTISITKTYYVIGKDEIISSPKTKNSYREVSIPQFLADELKEFIDKMYKIKPDERLFYTTKFSLLRALHKYGDKAGLSRLRVHDLRHSHISMLINLGYSAVSIAERVGHSSIAITYRYSHMFPTVQKDMANTFEKLNEKIG